MRFCWYPARMIPSSLMKMPGYRIRSLRNSTTSICALCRIFSGLPQSPRLLRLLKERKFDLVITMRRLGEINPLLFADQVKAIQDIPVVLLLNNSSELQYLPAKTLEPAILTILSSGTEIPLCLWLSLNFWKTE